MVHVEGYAGGDRLLAALHDGTRQDLVGEVDAAAERQLAERRERQAMNGRSELAGAVGTAEDGLAVRVIGTATWVENERTATSARSLDAGGR